MKIEQLNIESIIGSLVAVKMTPRGLGGNVAAVQISRDAETSHGAETGTVDSSISYLPPDIRHKIGTATSQLRTAWNTATLPWEDGGWRVVSSAGFMPLLDKIAPLKDARQRIIDDDLLKIYDEVRSASKKRLNGLFRDEDFPSKEVLARKFGVDIGSKAIQAASDIRIAGLSESAAEMIRKSVENQLREQIFLAITEVGCRLKGLVGNMLDKVTREKQDGVQYKGVQQQAIEVCESLKGLNITGDAKLAAMIDNVKKSVTQFSGDTLRSSVIARVAAKSKAMKLSDELNAMFA